MPPGVDVVSYSNGPDWVRGFRYALEQAKGIFHLSFSLVAGRVVMIVDCTNLLNMRHLYADGDRQWSFPYPDDESITTFDDVCSYLVSCVTPGPYFWHRQGHCNCHIR